MGSPPYGMTYFRRPTGRCSDGRLVVDFIAEALGLPMLPPYLGKGKSFRQGANFAVAGATALDEPFFKEINADRFMWTNLSLSAQLSWFEELKPSLCNTAQGCSEYLNKSLFLVGEIGGNDYNYAFFSGKTIGQAKSYTPKIIEIIAKSAQRLIDHGAVNLVVPGNMPIGCSAVYLTLFRGLNEDDFDSQTGCLKSFNVFARYHNALLRESLEKIRRRNPHARITYADYYGAVIRFNYHPEHFGFTHGVTTTCCGGGGPYNFNLNAACGHPGATACKDPSAYTNWDGVHLTEAAYRLIAEGLLRGPFAAPPIIGGLSS